MKCFRRSFAFSCRSYLISTRPQSRLRSAKMLQSPWVGPSLFDFSRTNPVVSDRQMRGYKADEFPRCNDLSVFPERRKVALISRDQIICAGCVRTLEKLIVV